MWRIHRDCPDRITTWQLQPWASRHWPSQSASGLLSFINPYWRLPMTCRKTLAFISWSMIQAPWLMCVPLLWTKQSLSRVWVTVVCREDRQSECSTWVHHGQKRNMTARTDISEVGERNEDGSKRRRRGFKAQSVFVRIFLHFTAHDWHISTGFGLIAANFYSTFTFLKSTAVSFQWSSELEAACSKWEYACYSGIFKSQVSHDA